MKFKAPGTQTRNVTIFSHITPRTNQCCCPYHCCRAFNSSDKLSEDTTKKFVISLNWAGSKNVYLQFIIYKPLYSIFGMYFCKAIKKSK